MDAWLDWARGPMFWAALTFMILGLGRLMGITAWETFRAVRRAGDRRIPYRQVLRATSRWLWPPGQLKTRALFGLTTLAFHIAILVVPLCLAGHVALWKRGLGVSWPTISNGLADVLTLVAIGTALALVIQRAAARASRVLSRFQDYAIPLAISVPFVSGFLVMHPAWNPLSFEAALLVHVLSANALLVLIPLTKISHCILLPFTQLVSEVAWHLTPDAGTKVAAALGKEGQPV